jgi:transposase
LWTFARVDGVEPTNNVVQRALRPAGLWRKRSFGSHSQAGCRFAERLLTMAATCRQQPLGFLVAAGDAAPQGTAAPSLLPVPQGGLNAYLRCICVDVLRPCRCRKRVP